MPNGKKKKIKPDDIFKLNAEDKNKTVVYNINPESKVVMLRAITKHGRIRFNGWWRSTYRRKDDRTQPIWWDEPSKCVIVPEIVHWEGGTTYPKDHTGTHVPMEVASIQQMLISAGFITVEVPLVGFLDRKFDLEEE